MTAKKHTFDIGTLSSAIDKISMQESKVFINLTGNEKTYEYTWKPANRDFLTALEGFVKIIKGIICFLQYFGNSKKIIGGTI